jgi:hypothetical protein
MLHAKIVHFPSLYLLPFQMLYVASSLVLYRESEYIPGTASEFSEP